MSASERLQKRMNELNVFAKKSLGQNFLVSDHVIDKIIQKACEVTDVTEVIEIGPGCGALTDLLKDRFKQLILIELDHVFVEYWKSQGMNVIAGDALQIDWSFASSKLLVSNLPYQISSSLVIDRSLDLKPMRAMILMFQKEVAQRIRAQCQSDHYGMLSVMAQEFWSIETVCDAGPRDFKPPPKIASRVLYFEPRDSNIIDRKAYLHFIKVCFQQRRRVLTTNLNALKSNSNTFDLKRSQEWYTLHKKNDKIRAEELSPAEFNSLFHFLKV